MKVFVLGLLALASLAAANPLNLNHPTTAFGYLAKYGIPEAERIRSLEESRSKIVGGLLADEGQYPYQAGLLISLIGFEGRAVCGASLVTSGRLVTAAHCWSDGVNQAWSFEVVLGSLQIFAGGTRFATSAVVPHPNWFPLLVRNDIAMIYLPQNVPTSATIAPVALPSGSLLLENFAGELGLASGFGLTDDSMTSLPADQSLHHVSLNIITNDVCRYAFPGILQDTNICTSGIGGVGTCSGDSGGPLVVTRNGERILVGVTSFGSALGCQVNLPAAFVRVTGYVESFINLHL